MKRVAAFTLLFVLLAWPTAGADYRGSDMLGNIGPSSQVQDGLADKYPLSAYALDYQVEAGVTDPDGVPPMIAQWAAAQLWSVTSLLVKCTIDLFTWAFSLDLLNGSNGALAPVAEAITSLYENVIGEAWMVVAILAAGIWGIWKALVQRRYTETAGALGVSVLFVVLALFFVYQPERTVGQASQWTNTISLAFLSGANRGSLDDPEQAKRQVSDHLFETLVYKPWVALEFGGLAHCVDTDRKDADGFPRPVAHDDPAKDICRDHIVANRAGYGGYAPRFLAEAPGSKERQALTSAIANGDVPILIKAAGRNPDPIKVDKADAPAVDIQQEGGSFQRLTFSVLVFIGALGAVALLGFLSLAVILAQVVALVLLGFAPVALIVGIFPGAGHAFFRSWLTKLATAIFIKALYSLVIAIVVAVSAALTASTGSLGFLFAFGLQTIFFWAIFLYRKQIANRLIAATTGAAGSPSMPSMSAVQRGAQAATKPFSALTGISPGASKRQESILAVNAAQSSGTSETSSPSTTTLSAATSNTTPAPDAPADDSPSTDTDTPGLPPVESPRFVRIAGDHGPKPSLEPPALDPAAAPDSPSGPSAPPPPSESGATVTVLRPPTTKPPEPPATPRSSHEDVMRRARELREQQRSAVPASEWDRA